MHFEVPSLPHSVKEFAAHYVMIVVSILTALGLEAAIEHLHHAHAAEAAQHAIETELRANLAGLRSSNADNLKRLPPLDDLTNELIKDFEEHVPTAQIKAQMAQRMKTGIDLGVFTPTLRHEAWDVAVANQSASYIEPETLRRLSAAYAAQREINDNTLYIFFNAPAYIDALTDARIGASDPHEFLHAVRQASLTLHGTQQKLALLEKRLERALPDEPQAETAAAKAPASAASAASSGR